MARMTMIEAIRDAMDVMMARDEKRRGLRRGCRLFRRRLPLHGGPSAEIRQDPLLRRADQRGRHRRNRHRHGDLRSSALRRDPVRRLHVSRLRPDRVRGGAAAIPLERGVHLSDGDAHADRRRHLRRADPQPEPGSAVHPRVRAEDGGAVQSLRRQGASDRRDRGSGSGDLPGAEAALQRPLRRSSRPPDHALVEA